MNFTVDLLPDLGIVEIVTNGMINHDARKEIICTAWAALKKSGTEKLLIDKSDSTRFFDRQMSGALSIIKLMNDLKFSSSTAIAVLNNHKELYDEFFEVMAQLKGFLLKSFSSKDDAIAWLRERPF